MPRPSHVLDVAVLDVERLAAADGSELDFLAGCSHVARFAEPSASGELEGAVILVPEERSGVMAPVASDDVRVPEIRVRSEDARSDLFLIGDQVVTAKDFVVGCSSDTDALMYRALWKQHDVFRDLDDTFVGIG